MSFVEQVKVKVRINLHGLFTVASASLTEKKETIGEPPENMETEDKMDKVREGHPILYSII